MELSTVNTNETKIVDYGQALNNAASFEQAMKMASFLSKTTFIPKEFQNQPENCLIALHMAGQLGINPFEVMKGIYVVHGKPAFSSQFAIALANLKGPFRGNITYQTVGKGTEMEVTARAEMKHTGEKVSASFSMEQALIAGWAKKNPHYQSIPENMLSYKAAMLLIRKTCPEILMGMQTQEEAIDSAQEDKKENDAIKIMNDKVNK